MRDYGRAIAKAGLEIKAIKLRPGDPFEWASGFRMPIYNDNRMFLASPRHRKLITLAFEEIIVEEGLEDCTIAGVATAGIPHATMIAHRLSAPLIYIRDKPKAHGLRNQIEGIDVDKDLAGRKVVVIEDLISTGGSSARAVQAVRNANGTVNYCLAIFDYNLDEAVNAFASLEPGCNAIPILTYNTLLAVAKETGYLTEDQVRLLEDWRTDPFGWGEKHGFPKVEKK
jgi:orotate phosphoribosyltransferase